VAPDAKNPPPHAAKKAGCATVAGAVASDFTIPIFAISSGHSAMPATAMPEAAVHEDSDAVTPEDKVRTTGQPIVSSPTIDAGGAQNGRQPELSLFVAT
jgi:hypothetical protein